MKILCVQTANLGDVVSSTVVINSLRDKFGRVDVLVRPEFAGTFEGEDQIFAVSEATALEREYDLAIDLDSSSKSRQLFKHLNSKKKIGRYTTLANRLKQNFIFDDQVPKNPKGHIVREYYSLLEKLGFNERPEPKLVKTNDPKVDKLLHQLNPNNTRLAVIHFTASNSLRNLPEDLVQKTVEHLQSQKYSVLFIGSEKDLLEAMVVRCPGSHYHQFTIDELKATLSRADIVVGSDSGPMHMAAALGIRGVGIYGPALGKTVAPLSPRIKRVEKDFPCRPCNQNRPCPYNKRCLNTVTAEEVINSL